MQPSKDAYGIEIGEGDVIVSAATSGWTMTVGYARYRPRTLAVEAISTAGSAYYKTRQVGSWVMVLRKADGTVPDHLKALTQEIKQRAEEIRHG